ncbi:MAG: GSCFA domain-containing protein [Bacteroidota bacterium]|nr:GSCFA domain-containing protein [Bacteroidota bacterium]
MQFHLNYNPKKFDFTINHSHKVFLIGSCFSENVGNFLIHHKFNVLSNPNGILFNPSSIHNCLNDIVSENLIDESLILKRDDNYFSYLHHTSINANSKTELITKINSENKKAQQFLKESDYLFITFGTAFYYQHLSLNKTVANCHKQPAATFDKKCLSVLEITESYSRLLKNLKQLNPKQKVIFTVSPVKHLKDGVIENNLSKSILILAIHELIKQNTHCYYFPSYELVNDDLRDYRFYKEDLAHPNELAINYVLEKFSTTCFDEKTITTNSIINKINLALNHREMNASEPEQLKLQAFITKQKEELKKINPEIDF